MMEELPQGSMLLFWFRASMLFSRLGKKVGIMYIYIYNIYIYNIYIYYI